MFEQIQLIKITQTKNKNGETIETEDLLEVSAVEQTVKREQRDQYNIRGLGSVVRFQIALFGPGYNAQVIPYFIYNGVRYSVTDFVKDKTGTHYYIEGTTSKGKV